jgi:hypothetical protein
MAGATANNMLRRVCTFMKIWDAHLTKEHHSDLHCISLMYSRLCCELRIIRNTTTTTTARYYCAF